MSTRKEQRYNELGVRTRIPEPCTDTMSTTNFSAMHVSSHAAAQARCPVRVLNTDQFRRTIRSCSARRRSDNSLTSCSASVHSASFAATVSPDVAEESASPSKSYEQSNNKATTQQSTGASHVKSCYPEKTINCSNGNLMLLYKRNVNSSCAFFDSCLTNCRGVEG